MRLFGRHPFSQTPAFMDSHRLRSLGLAGGTLFMLVAAAVVIGRGAEGDGFMPHAHCYLFNEKLMLLHGGSDLLIGLSYVAISATLTYLVVRSRRDLPFHWMMLAFALFIVACGGTHFMELWTLRSPHPQYWLSGWVKGVTAAASLVTAMLLPPLIPKIREVLASARLATAHKTELERAYRELSELYKKATAPTPKKESLGSISRIAVPAEPESGEPKDLAEMAKEVSVHARELEVAKQAAEAANRAKDQFLAVLSHELRTPLTPALTAASNLETAENIDPRELRESLALIRRNIELEARLVDDLLDLTRISKGKLQIHVSTINLHETVQHAAEMCRSEAHQKQANLVLHLEAADHYVRGDGARLAQVSWNLILNAVKFTPAEGRITVRTCNPEPGRVRIEVEDTGIGIEPEMLARIFEPFQQGEENTTRRFGGLGLGLSVAKGLIIAHGGSISVASDGKDRGAKFTVEMATTEPPAAPKIAPAMPSSAPQRSLRILLAEDHEDTRRALDRLLTRWGHQVRTAPTIADALAIAGDFLPQVLLSDIGLPDGTGIELIGKIRNDHEIIAIAMSGYGMEADMELTKHAGFAEHLVKPVSAERLKESIERLLNSHFP
jgi:signal transduction histidine kinase